MATTQNQTKTDRDPWKELVLELRTLADEIRVKIHLGSMDAKDAWNELEPKMRSFEGRIEKAGTKIENELKTTARDLRDRFRKLRDGL